MEGCVIHVMIQEDDLYHIDKVLSGNTGAFAFLVEKYKEMVYTLAVSIMNVREEAEEAAQDAFVKAFQSLPKYKHKAKFSTWLYRIVYNECISRRRRRKLKTVSFEDFKMANNEDVLIGDDETWNSQEKRKRLVIKALAGLPESDRIIVMLYYYEDHPVEEIARITSLTASNVKIRLYRARKKLHGVLSKEFENVYI